MAQKPTEEGEEGERTDRILGVRWQTSTGFSCTSPLCGHTHGNLVVTYVGRTTGQLTIN
jgi:hypothetical protein